MPKPIAWGALLMPLLWTAMSYFAWGTANPSLRARVDWTSFVLSQLMFGIVAWALVVLIVLHIGAAFKHLLIDKDGVFGRMWPWQS